MNNTDLTRLAKRLVAARSMILEDQPFFGRLLFHIPVSLSSDVETAYTDMKNIVFGAEFVEKLGMDELIFVFLHETMHCVLKHPARGNGFFPPVYNIACDIVVNSLLFESLSYNDSFTVDGEVPMHLTPSGEEGRYYTAEQVYKMFIKMTPQKLQNFLNSKIDSHENWNDIDNGESLEEIWDSFIKNAANSPCWSDVPGNLKRQIGNVRKEPGIDWKQVLHDFIQNNMSDYTFLPPDKRFSDDFILPSFQPNIYGLAVEHIWFCVDTSASVSNEALSLAMGEIEEAILQIENVSGYISFFDADITTPKPFNNVEEVKKMSPFGNGGTDFTQIFEKIPEFFEEEPPKAIIVLTDGLAPFPKEEKTHNIPILWIIVDSNINPPIGVCVHISSKK